ncbi:hypothetical protein IRB23SM22_20710 [Alkalibacterium sp. s-m-22]
MNKEFFSKTETIDYVWQHSKYYGNLLSYCKDVAEKDSGNGFVSLIFLFNLMENIFKSSLKNYDARLIDVIDILRDNGTITKIEHDFLNNKNNGIRIIRNLLSHSNLSKYNLIFTEDGTEIYYPLTENETCLKMYEMISDILFNLMLRIISTDTIEPLNIDLDDKINNVKIKIKKCTPEKLMEFRGIDVSIIPNWEELNESDKYRIVESSSDVRMVTNIASTIFKNYLE